MDIIFRLRFLLWVFVLGLWGALAYEFLQEEMVYQPPRLTTLKTPFERDEFQGDTRASPGPLPMLRTAPLPSPSPIQGRGVRLDALPTAPPAAVLPPVVALARAPRLPRRAPPRKSIPHEWAEEGRREAEEERPTHQHEETAERPFGEAQGGTPETPRAPAGFETARTAHFVVFSQGGPAPERFLEMLETLHANLMLDLAAFAPWARSERVTLYLFKTQAAYQKFTGRPAWSGGSSSVDRRTLYLYESSELTGILAHELTHVYFDSFFTGGKPDPLWLSEGMATFIQIQRGLAAPNWIRPNLERLVDGKGYGLKELLGVGTLAGVSDGSVRLWYTQSYSLVRFLIRSKWFVSYYQFCKNLRDGKPVHEALYRAYGMPYNRLSALELAWRYDLKTHELSNLAKAPTTQ